MKKRIIKRLMALLKLRGERLDKPGDVARYAGPDWIRFNGLNDAQLEKKLEALPELEMLELYKKLERESGFRIDPLNYRPHVIVKNFMILWIRKIEDEQRKAAQGEKLEPMTNKEISRIWGDGSRGIAGRITRISSKDSDREW
ncbi:hypothetical protein ES703_02965 [subsurface metagenome]